jgi:serine phosphatase RsbU (regulator of sigma subunit)
LKKKFTYLVLLHFLFVISFAQNTERLKRLIKESSTLLDNAKHKEANLKIDTLFYLANIDENEAYIAEAYLLRGVICDQLNEYPDALNNYASAISIYKKYDLKERAAGVYNNIGKIYKTLDEFKTALSYYFKAANIYKEKDSSNNLRITYNNMGTCYQELKQFASAKHYLYLSLEISQSINDSFYTAIAYHNIGLNHQYQNSFDTSLVYFRKSLSYLTNITPGIFNLIEMGNSFFRKGSIDSSEKYLLKAEQIIHKEGTTDNLVEVAKSLALVYEQKNDFRKAYFYQKLNKHLEDSINQQSFRAEVVRTEMEKTYADEKLKQEYQQRTTEIDNQNKKRLLNYTLLALAISIVLVVISLRSYLQKRKANFIISKQKEIVEYKNKEILDSINYAKRIQSAQLTSPHYISEHVAEHFIYYKPRDIVSGDFYWALKQNDIFYFVVGDCTGHGVPGAFMSLLNINLLNEVIIERRIGRPDLILNEIRREIIKTLKNETDEVEIRDGMDCVICAFDFQEMKLHYACANNKFFVARQDELIISFTTKMPVGRSHDDTVPFKLFEMPIEKGDVLYLTTDGYIGQFGGPLNKKFKYARLEQKLLEISHLPISKQHKLIEQTFDTWKGECDQVDDVCVVGIKI